MASEFVAITNLGSCGSRILAERRKAQYDNEEAQDGKNDANGFCGEAVVNLRVGDGSYRIVEGRNRGATRRQRLTVRRTMIAAWRYRVGGRGGEGNIVFWWRGTWCVREVQGYGREA